MATHAPAPRVPFAPLDNPRLQHLASAKNRQNGVIAQKSSSDGKANNFSPSKSLLSPNKRSFEHFSCDDADGENVDPATVFSPSKKSRSDAPQKPLGPFTFSSPQAKLMPPPPTIPSRLSTPTRANISSPRAPLTAPAGRSPKRKTLGINKNRRISAPFTRVDPPSSSRNSSALPFSLDAALSGTFANATPQDAGATIQESMPKDWFFDIHEDTPEEEASNLMEHSTLTLDLSSDDESSKNTKDDRGKENTPPEGYDAPAASQSTTEPTVAAPRHVKKNKIVRKKVVSDAMDDGERSPLSDLDTDFFIPEGLTKDSYHVVHPSPEKKAESTEEAEAERFEKLPLAVECIQKSTEESEETSMVSPTQSKNASKTQDAILVWEDEHSAEEESISSPTANTPTALMSEGTDSVAKTCDDKAEASDENVQPTP